MSACRYRIFKNEEKYIYITYIAGSKLRKKQDSLKKQNSDWGEGLYEAIRGKPGWCLLKKNWLGSHLACASGCLGWAGDGTKGHLCAVLGWPWATQWRENPEPDVAFSFTLEMRLRKNQATLRSGDTELTVVKLNCVAQTRQQCCTLASHPDFRVSMWRRRSHTEGPVWAE